MGGGCSSHPLPSLIPLERLPGSIRCSGLGLGRGGVVHALQESRHHLLEQKGAVLDQGHPDCTTLFCASCLAPIGHLCAVL